MANFNWQDVGREQFVDSVAVFLDQASSLIRIVFDDERFESDVAGLFHFFVSQLGIYDCLYIALAQQEQCEIVTDDARLIALFPDQVLRLGSL